MSRILGVIPARYASTRFPAKPLADLAGKSMIRRVYEQARMCKGLSKVIVATDDEKIFKHVTDFQGEVCMTSADHVSGTDRCYEALSLQKESFDHVVNIQGDEPFISPEQIDLIISLCNGENELATLKKKIESSDDVLNPNIVKVICNVHDQAIYFSRSPLPHQRNIPQNEWINKLSYFKHIGMYAYRSDILKQITSLAQSPLEKSESLEQLRWIENGFKIAVAETVHETIGIDTPEDLEKAVEYLRKSTAS